MALELGLVALARAEIERDAVVGARHDDGRVAGDEVGGGGAAQPVGEQDGIALARLDGVDLILQRMAQLLGRVVQSLAEETCGDGMGRGRGRSIDGTRQRFTGQGDVTGHRVKLLLILPTGWCILRCCSCVGSEACDKGSVFC